MSEGILGNATGGFGFPRTYILTDENGNELTGVYVESETIFTATDNDVREGMVYASDAGVSTGTKNIPSYHTGYGSDIVLENNEVIIETPECDYSNLSVIITEYNTSVSKSTSSTYVSINNGMYAVGSSIKVSDITVNEANGQIKLGLIVPEKSVVRYLVTREEF